ncbi:hypothetical protein B0H12DRAFT_1073725 [Mycena haematopus]|nr:hypothetical protein B0H12DRAFT_1073725 [Mycena haematopus]
MPPKRTFLFVTALLISFIPLYLAQAVIENIMLLDLLSPMSGVEVQGDGYLLLGDKIPWPEGKDLCAIWGDDEVTVAKHQWTFVFNPVACSSSLIQFFVRNTCTATNGGLQQHILLQYAPGII